MVLKESKTFVDAKSQAITKLTEAYKAVTDLLYYVDKPELENMGDAILDMRSTIRFIYEDE